MDDGTTRANCTLPRRSEAREPSIVVEFLDGPESEQTLDALARALARRAARALFMVERGNAAPPGQSDRDDG